MKNRTNMVAAIIAVALMMGCALVPLINENINGEISVTSNDDETGDFSIADIIEAINNIGLNGGIDLGNGTSLVAIDSPELQPVEDKTDISGVVPVAEGETLYLNGEYNFSTNEDGANGRYEVMSGAEVKLFPLGENSDITLVNNNTNKNDHPAALVHMHSGSILTIFGQSFKLLYYDDGTVENGTHLLRLDSTWGPQSKCVINYDNSDGANITLDVKVHECSKFMVFNFICFEYNKDKPDAKDLSISGTLGKDNDATVFDGYITVDSRHGNDTFSFDFDTFVKLTLAKSTEKTENGNDVVTNTGNIYFYGTMDEFKLTNGRTNTTLTITDVYIGTEEKPINIDLSYTAEFGSDGKLVSLKKDVHTENNEPICISADSIEVAIAGHLVKSVVLKLCSDGASQKYVDITLSNVNRHADLTYDSEGEITGTDKTDMEVSVSAPFFKFDIKVDESLTLHELKIDEMEMLADITVTHEKSGATTDFNLFTISGTIAESITGSLLNDYKITFSLTAAGLKTVYDRESTVTTGNFLITLSTEYNGMYRYLTLSIDDFKKTVDKESNVTEIEKIHFKNELPLKYIFKGIVNLADNAEIEFDIDSMKITDDEITMRTLSVHYWNYNVIDDLYAEFDTVKVTYNDTAKKYDIHGDTVTGYILDNGKKSNFSMTGITMRVGFSNNEASAFIVMHLISGSAKFNEGGRLPMYIKIEDGVEFESNGLQLLRLNANDTSAALSGTVIIDTEDGFAPSSVDRAITLNGRYMTVALLEDNVGLGSRVTFNLAPNSEGHYNGYIMPSENHVLPAKAPADKDNIHYELLSDRVTFESSLSAAGNQKIKCRCPGDVFSLSYEGMEGEPLQVHAGTIVDLSTILPTGYDGWTDGSGKIYLGTESYVMPARNVNFKPVTSETASTFIESEGKSIINAETSDVVLIPTSETPTKDTVEIIILGAKIDMDSMTYMTILPQGGSKYIVFSALLVETVESNGSVYDIHLTDENGTSLEYGGSTEFNVTLNVAVSGDVKDFVVNYIDDMGHTQSVGVDSWKKCSGGTYDVTFTVNHFSEYSVEPVYKGTSDSTIVVVAIIGMVAIMIVGAFFCILPRRP